MNGYQELSELEKSVAHANCQLYTVAHKLHAVEQHLDSNLTNSAEGGGEIDDICVLELLESMTEVKNEYQNLRKDLREVQQLQRDVTSSIRCQMHQMQNTFVSLKKRIELKAATTTSQN